MNPLKVIKKKKKKKLFSLSSLSILVFFFFKLKVHVFDMLQIYQARALGKQCQDQM